jgi:hypothetical protein
VLSAAGRDGRPQLEALRNAIASAKIGVRLHVITGDEDVLAAATGPGVTGEWIAPSSPQLCAQIGAAKPHLLHVLSHGGVVAGVSTLSFGTIPDFDSDRKDAGSLPVFVQDLVRALAECDPWLVVLSACQSAATAEATDMSHGRALAHDIVSAGVTAVVGMRRLVDLQDTDRFCQALYPEVLAAMREAVVPAPDGEPHGERVLDWAAALTKPRRVMSGADPSLVDSWLDPVLYVQRDDLRVFPPSQRLSPTDYAGLQGKLDLYRDSKAKLVDSAAPESTVAEVSARIADIEAMLVEAGV